ncbi:hypothetical protein PMPD1_3033 [Paramixta manurensis]|uniref:Uncharacterized protein n=1 Tax=Paramixta manurensis TaxID=2740817 RepID=A0A6M8UAX6_9GAMM|nr:hypothetical protein PMPD1_3033 [Erwiniaceae bacterium PD-1]
MRELTLYEVENVSGAGVIDGLGALAGNLVIDVVKLINDVCNTSFGFIPGQLADRIGLSSVHHAIDSFFYGIYKGVIGVAVLLGGDGDRVTYHYEEEWGS